MTNSIIYVPCNLFLYFMGKSYGLGIFREILWIGDFPVCDISFRKESRSDSKFVGGDDLGVRSKITAVEYVLGVRESARLVFRGCGVLARGASHGIWNPFFPHPWGARGAIIAAALHALTAGS